MELLARHGHRDLSAHHRAVHWHDGDQLGALAPQVLAALGPLVITRAESILAPLVGLALLGLLFWFVLQHGWQLA